MWGIKMARNIVHVMMHKLYFDNKFEPDRKRLEKQLGIKLSQSKYTEHLAKNNPMVKVPRNRGMPKQFKKNVRRFI